MSDVTVQPVRSFLDRRAFINFPYQLYRGDKHWIAPLRIDTSHLINPKKNAFFEHGEIQPFVARDARGEVVGRVAGVVNGMHLKKYDDGAGFFGFFECIDDVDTARCLLDGAANWLRERDLRVMRGPTNPSLNDVSGLLVNGFDRPPAILMPFNKPYYESLVLQAGMERIVTMWSYYANSRLLNAERLRRGEDIVLRRNPSLSVRHLDMSRWDEEVRTLLDIFNDAWADNWGHVPMTEGEIEQLAGELKMIVNPDLVNVVEDNGVPVGFSVSLPDINYALATMPNGRLVPFGLFKLLFSLKMNLIRETRMPLMGVRKTHQGRGIDALLVSDVLRRNRDIGMLGCEMSWVLDENQVLKNFLVSIGGIRENEYALFEKDLTR